ncbi:MAG: 50S ribosomal protein L32 [Dehalococcoidia bacterium]
MGALPKKKLTRSRRGKRRAHASLQPLHLSRCPQCGSPRLPHRVCSSCGSYKGQEVLAITTQERG